jgi:hypothetical protein
MWRRWLVSSVLVWLAAGCAVTAVRPPSPAAALTVESLLATPAPPHERYFVLIFGSQSCPPRPCYSHTWATAVKLTEGQRGSPPTVEQYTISWMPATLQIRPWCFRTEKGTNLDLHVTIEEMLRNGERVSMWGPYETWHGLYARFVTQKAFLDSGAIGYQCFDSAGEAGTTGMGSNCIHAVTDMDPQFHRPYFPLVFFGEAASFNIVRQLFARPVLIRPYQTHDWLIPALGLDRYPICRRVYQGPAKEFSPHALLAASN